MDRIIRSKPLSKKVYDTLSENIKQMTIGQNRLPSEEELAKILGVSRATIREAMNYLTLQGAITKLQGKGNFGHPSIFNIENRLDLYPNFLTLLLKKYDNVKLNIKYKGISKQTKDCQIYFSENSSEDVYKMDWIYCAGEQALILGKFEFFTPHFKQFPDENGPEITGLQDFSKYYLYKAIAYCAMYLKCGIDTEAADCFKVSKKTSMQCWEELIFDIDDQKVGFCKFFLHPDEMVMSVVTRFNNE